eukprot:TRINITY_DN1087_c0_g1_i1.p1 TRINITY_DN1087_c0_g1~~TRINITY_DN1087_c0_g1_i1.p1  ORF type:complete len:57 (+),score=2.58 TRINITY_DN1087_c0_g1_i1:24-194(+)
MASVVTNSHNYFTVTSDSSRTGIQLLAPKPIVRMYVVLSASGDELAKKDSKLHTTT